MSQTDINQVNILIKQHEEAIDGLEKLKSDFESKLEDENAPEPVEPPTTPPQIELSDEEEKKIEEEKEAAEKDDEDEGEEPVVATSSDTGDTLAEQSHIPDGHGDPNDLVDQQDAQSLGEEAETIDESGADVAGKSGGTVVEKDEKPKAKSAKTKKAAKKKA